MDLYRENILDHYKNPRNFGKIQDADVTHHESNPLCGDEITIQLKLDADGKVTDARFDGVGCAISISSASMLLETLKGKSIDEIKKIDKEVIFDLLGTEVGPGRIKCALLPLKTLHIGIENYERIKNTEKQ